MAVSREHIIALLDAGYMTQSEAAELAGVSRQRIHQWVLKAGIHPLVSRERHLRKLLKYAHQ